MNKILSKIEQEIIIQNFAASSEEITVTQGMITQTVAVHSLDKNRFQFFCKETNFTEDSVQISFYYRERLFSATASLKREGDFYFFEIYEIFYLDDEFENSISEIHADLYYSLEKNNVIKLPCIIPDKEIFMSYSETFEKDLFSKIKKVDSVIKKRISPIHLFVLNDSEIVFGSYSEGYTISKNDKLVLDLEIDSLKGKRKIQGSFIIQDIISYFDKYLYIGKFCNLKKEDQRYLQEKSIPLS